MVKIEGGLNTSSGGGIGKAKSSSTTRKTPVKRKPTKRKKFARKKKRQEPLKTLYLWPPLSDFLEHQYSLPVNFPELVEKTWTKIKWMNAYDSGSATISLIKLPLFKNMLKHSTFGTRDSINGFGELSSAIKATNLYFKTPYVPGINDHRTGPEEDHGASADSATIHNNTSIVRPLKNPTIDSSLQPTAKSNNVVSYAVSDAVSDGGWAPSPKSPAPVWGDISPKSVATPVVVSMKPHAATTAAPPSPSSLSDSPELIWKIINEYSATYEGYLQLNYIEGRKSVRCSLNLTERFFGVLPSSNLCYEMILLTGVSPPPNASLLSIDKWPKKQAINLQRLIIDEFKKSESTGTDGSTKYSLSWSGKLEIPRRSEAAQISSLQPSRTRSRIASVSGTLSLTEGSVRLTEGRPGTYDIIMVRRIMDMEGIVGQEDSSSMRPLIYKILPPNRRDNWTLWPNLGVVEFVEEGDWLPVDQRNELIKFIRYYKINGSVLSDSDLEELLSYLSDPSLNLPRWVMVKFYRTIQALLA